jgi:hypothetical protein
MLRIVTIPLLAIILTIPALAADEWSGRLVDANCTHTNGGPHACDPGLNTTAFGLVVAGKPFLFDRKGNQKASEAIKYRALTNTNPNHPPSPEVNASVTGERSGKKILVKSIVLE